VCETFLQLCLLKATFELSNTATPASSSKLKLTSSLLDNRPRVRYHVQVTDHPWCVVDARENQNYCYMGILEIMNYIILLLTFRREATKRQIL